MKPKFLYDCVSQLNRSQVSSSNVSDFSSCVRPRYFRVFSRKKFRPFTNHQIHQPLTFFQWFDFGSVAGGALLGSAYRRGLAFRPHRAVVCDIRSRRRCDVLLRAGTRCACHGRRWMASISTRYGNRRRGDMVCLGKLFPVRILVAVLALGGRLFEVGVDQLGLKIWRFVTVDAGFARCDPCSANEVVS